MKLFSWFKQAGSVDAELQAKLEQEHLARRARNEARIEAIKQEMGELYILHPAHKKSRLDAPRPV